MSIGIIGLGNIGYSLVQGLASAGLEETITAFDHNAYAESRAKRDYATMVVSDNIAAVFESEVVCVCIRTSQVNQFLIDNSAFFKRDNVLVFLSSGLKIDLIKKAIGQHNCEILRVIANVNVASQNGQTIMLKNRNDLVYAKVTALFRRVGSVIEVDTEEQLDILSVLTGCTPAIVALFFESLIESGMTIGVSRHQTEDLIENCMHKTLNTMHEKELTPWELRQRVCSPGGVLIKYLREIENDTTFKNNVANWLPQILAALQK